MIFIDSVRDEASTVLTAESIFTEDLSSSLKVKFVATPSILTFSKLDAPSKVILPLPTVTIMSEPLIFVEYVLLPSPIDSVEVSLNP